MATDIKGYFDVEVLFLLISKVVHLSKLFTNVGGVGAGGGEVAMTAKPYNHNVMTKGEVEEGEMQTKEQERNILKKIILPIKIRDKSPDPVGWDA